MPIYVTWHTPVWSKVYDSIYSHNGQTILFYAALISYTPYIVKLLNITVQECCKYVDNPQGITKYEIIDGSLNFPYHSWPLLVPLHWCGVCA